MQLPDLAILAFVEGVADILPIDATGHALVVSKVAGWRAGTIGATVHIAAAMALLFYLWRDVLAIGLGLWRIRRRRIEPGSILLVKAAVAATPWLIVTTLLLAPPVPGLGDLTVVGAITIASALVMGLVDKMSMTVKRIEHLEYVSALVVGVIQLLALIPGVGRVAAGLTMARLSGLERPDAYRFVLLTNIPILLAEGGRSAVQYYFEGLRPADSDVLVFAVTFVFVLLAVSATTAWIRRAGLWPFCLYRLLVGGGLIALAGL
ncbi:undecaprenyl-diphosphate phosphatase [Telmatospirillum sp.]|uniref:undecaprenyl-diphosphate phosphatase n=1 Tax=Telmatospirillum sp. TaxID=2079197 RepID=UPI002847C5E4|nr:undecaprenyl-diphosphate phosphatase [Telmatospirillum sp.]MDR3439546.1 undecaprenyl-diphosphate phosphatase [Telmatospirillum sp.]